ncbi:F-box/kelch-repeat protein At3g23880-like [Vicia villosa]|uniref:F-box/kelch-repeat protein At3g23880-like n=1 Tax=Vicia villosa TaxID=3911 RepID=UPI00273AF785|nr:F-box/kelch-repeat protein At3g23880-like [Vicia villosa]
MGSEFLPLELIEEILCRLPVKELLQFRCVCKCWNSLICDPKFHEKHLTYSTTLAFHFINYFNPSSKFILTSYPIDTLFTNNNNNNNVTTTFTRLEYPQHYVKGYQYHLLTGLDYFVGSCHGILCLTNKYGTLLLLWNPSIRKYKELPLFQRPLNNSGRTDVDFGFGYDHVNHVYKVVAVLSYVSYDVTKTEVKVHTLGTDFWKSIHEFPFGCVSVAHSGQFVAGAINWLAYNRSHHSFIVSFDLEKESYQQILPPDNTTACRLGVWKDCMWLISGRDLWLMKEYGNKESWTKLFTISCDFSKVIDILDDDRVLLEYMDKMIVYNFTNHTFKFTDFEIVWPPQVSVESLIDITTY